jgi:hypothetical protein
MRKALLVFCLLLGAALPASAQSQSRPDPVALESARALIAESDIGRTLDALLAPMSQQITQLLRAANPEHAALVSQLMDELMMPELRRRMPELLELTTILYAQHFTAAEIDEVRAFYRTPTGQKFLSKQTVLALEGQLIGQVWGQRAALDALARLRPELERRGLKTPRI